ncbi:MAG TPA: FMN-binding protein [Jatrophihabitantaceae bacterium]|nr:FMN-binding protein [Jatrophihabitantaceae bacterium]
MKRILLALVGTVAGLAALLSFKTHSGLTGGAALPAASLPSSAPSSTSGGASAPSSSAPPEPGQSSAAKTIAGQAIQTRYGVVQVQIVVSGQKIQNASFLQLTADDPRSAEINSQAGPILLQQTLSAQSSQIDGVSGATYTSDGYLQSLQSALDQAGIK